MHSSGINKLEKETNFKEAKINQAEFEKDERWKKEEDRILLRDIFYVFIVLWLSVFIAEYFFLDKNATPFDRIFGYIIIFLPLGTLNFFLHYLYRNRKIRVTGKLRSSLRYRLILAFLLVSIIPAMPIFLLTSSRVESIISIFFKLDLKGGMESAENMLSIYENQYAKELFENLKKNKNDFVFFIKNISEIKKERFKTYVQKWFNEDYDSIYLYDTTTLIKLYGKNLINSNLFNLPKENYKVFLIQNQKYIYIN